MKAKFISKTVKKDNEYEKYLYNGLYYEVRKNKYEEGEPVEYQHKREQELIDMLLEDERNKK